MELLELLRILQSNQDQANAEQNKEVIEKMIIAINDNAEIMQQYYFVMFCFMTILAIGLVLVYLDHRKAKKQLAKLIGQNQKT